MKGNGGSSCTEEGEKEEKRIDVRFEDRAN